MQIGRYAKTLLSHADREILRLFLLSVLKMRKCGMWLTISDELIEEGLDITEECFERLL